MAQPRRAGAGRQTKVLTLFPPNYRAINEKFNVRGKPILFAFGDLIYNPGRIKVPPQLIAHEQVHSARQGGNPFEWWARYIDDPQFRLAEEIPAHAAEYRHLLARGQDRIVHIAGRLSSPLYGGLVDLQEAKRLILNDVESVASDPVSHAGE
jgi:hypothetical protein